MGPYWIPEIEPSLAAFQANALPDVLLLLPLLCTFDILNGFTLLPVIFLFGREGKGSQPVLE